MAEINLIDSDSDCDVPAVAMAKVSPDVQTIMAMGFGKHHAELALQIKKGNLQEAINALMDGEVMVPAAPSPAKVRDEPFVAKKRGRADEPPLKEKSASKKAKAKKEAKKLKKASPAPKEVENPKPPVPAPAPKPVEKPAPAPAPAPVRAASSSLPSSAASSSMGQGNPKSMKRLHHEIMKLQSEAGQEEQDSMGVHVTPSGDGDDLYRWDIKISKWDDSTSLGRSCKKNKVDEILLSMIVPEEYPLKPPFVRVVWPELQGGYVFGGGAICFELLTDAGWSPSTRLISVGLSINGFFNDANMSISNTGDRKKKTIPRYTEETARKEFGHILKIHDNGRRFHGGKLKS